ncbi:DUF2911 domain-containing protein [Niabella beijingensis]|uniref:DUF2911 domain-containing protein n=1 Tax=Niabella beijingensis TaxID=2872700 RepID=UPI001CC1598B|nr:DUF2911 domain-containing protein [Niabella beijingensis]MBZ4189567.1 DUF2911 domain-containing protein [Niabella beijingensis]
MNCMKGGWVLLAGIVLLIACNQKPENKTTPQVPVVDAPRVAQPVNTNNPYEAVDVSPLDMSYFPVHYPLHKMSGTATEKPVMRVIYSRPHLQGRALFGSVLKYDQPWRMGANEATELDVFRPVFLNNKKIEPGRYTLYSIPHEESWTIVLNNNLDTWGLQQDSTQDLLRVEVPSTGNNPMVEYFTMVFKKTPQGADLLIAWERILVRLPFIIK